MLRFSFRRNQQSSERKYTRKKYCTCLFPFLLLLRFRKFRRKSCSNNTGKNQNDCFERLWNAIQIFQEVTCTRIMNHPLFVILISVSFLLLAIRLAQSLEIQDNGIDNIPVNFYPVYSNLQLRTANDYNLLTQIP